MAAEAGSFSELRCESSSHAHGGALGGGLRGMMASCTPPRCRMLLRGRAGDSVEPAAGSVTAALIVQVALLSLIHLSNV